MSTSNKRKLFMKKTGASAHDDDHKPLELPALPQSDKSIDKDADPQGRRKAFQNMKRGSVVKQVSSFMNVFNSFAGDDLKPKRRSKLSSNLLNFPRNESSQLLPSYLVNSKSMKVKKPSQKGGIKMYLGKNRSRSVLPVQSQREIKGVIRRTLSDFHE